MRPYLAIIKDSFREALASRVLWVLLLMITVVMLALLPFHWQSTIAADVSDQDVRSIRTITNALKAGQDEDATPLSKHIWNSLEPKTKEQLSNLTAAGGPEAMRARRRLTRNINTMIEKDDFFDEQLWSDVSLGSRAKELLDRSPLQGDELKQFNRLVLEAALPGQIRQCPDEAVMFRYAKWDMDFIPQLRRKDAVQIIDQFMITFMGIFVGFFGIFAGVLVTAPIIPNMLNSGSLYVLLSKPVARPMLFISKFLGGCSFVTINATYLIIGLWLILGLRFGLWKGELLWSIPLFLFSFAIFYSVSALSGLVWNSPIMAIVATILFWFMCSMVGVTRGFLEQLVMVPGQINSVMATDSDLQNTDLFVTRSNGEIAMWDPGSGELTEIFEDTTPDNRRGPEMIMGPSSSVEGMIYDEKNERLVVLDRKWSQSNIITGTKSEGFRRDKKLPAPRNARAIFQHKGQLITVADGGVYPVRLDAEPVEEKKGSSIFGVFTIPAVPTEEEEVAKLSGDLGQLPADARVAYDRKQGAIYIHGAQSLQKLTTKDEVFQKEKVIQLDLSDVSHIAAAGDVVAIANKDDDSKIRLHTFDGNLAKLTELETESETDVRQLDLSSDGRFLACLFDNDELTVFDLDDNKKVIRRLKSTASVSFNSEALTVAGISDRVETLRPPSFERQEVVNPNLPFIKQLYRYFVNPLYLIFPKPSELQNTMTYLITGKDTVKVEGPGMGAGGRTVKLDPWQPLWSNSIFIGVMLLIGCVYVFRRDF